jgi:hypothetical protein
MAKSAALFVAICALPSYAAIVEPPGLAPNLRVSPGEEVALLLTGDGTNLYQCKPRATDPSTHAWFFVTPDATLYDSGRPVATHTAAYRWDSTSDRSSVTGVIVAIQDGGPNNLPWALFRALPAAEAGMFAGITSIQRVNTSGGAVPAQICDAVHAGEESRVPFSADYYFYRRRGGAA